MFLCAHVFYNYRCMNEKGLYTGLNRGGVDFTHSAVFNFYYQRQYCINRLNAVESTQNKCKKARDRFNILLSLAAKGQGLKSKWIVSVI